MITTLVQDATAPADDAELVAALSRACGASAGRPGRLLAAIYDNDGSIYRLIQCESATELATVGAALQAFGFIGHLPGGVLLDTGYAQMFDREPAGVPVLNSRPGGDRSRRRPRW